MRSVTLKSSNTKKQHYTTDVVIVGAGPATLGLLTNACKTNR